MDLNKKGNIHKDISGQKFNRLFALEYVGRERNGYQYKHMYRCLCDCGKEVIVKSESLKNGNTKSCGCYKIEKAFKHGMSQTRIFSIWTQMFERCYKPKWDNYKNYGGRGIRVCERWHEFLNFYEDMKDGYSDELTLDRIDNDGNYEPSNCRWATWETQSYNRRNTVYLTIDGITKLIREWAKESPVSLNTIKSRVNLGWEHKKAVFNPLRKGVNFQYLKLSESDCFFILNNWNMKTKDLAARFDVSIGTIERIKYGYKAKHKPKETTPQ